MVIAALAVEMFGLFCHRRYLGERLTEAVVKEIEHRTPYKVVDADRADMVLTGVIVRDDKDLLIKNHSGDPRVNRITMGVQVNWAGRATTLPLPSATTEVDASAQFVPEVGHSVATA